MIHEEIVNKIIDDIGYAVIRDYDKEIWIEVIRWMRLSSSREDMLRRIDSFNADIYLRVRNAYDQIRNTTYSTMSQVDQLSTLMSQVLTNQAEIMKQIAELQKAIRSLRAYK